jgi:hypothetical protein
MTNEVLVKQERNAWAVVLKALAEARSSSITAPTGVPANSHITRVTGNALTLGGLNNLMTLVKRINSSYAGGSTDSTYGLTDLFVSPEIKGDIRAFAYNAVTNSSTDLPAGVREDIYRNAGTQEIYGISIHELVEFGVGKKYNTLFDDLSAGTPVFNGSTDEILVGLDLSKDAFVRPVARNSETGGTFTALPDDQFTTRADKVGFYGSLEEGRVCLDGRAVAGLIVTNP